LAALSTVPQSLYDAAKVDGAGSFKQFIYITFPLIGKIIWFVGLLAFMWSFNSFDLIWLTTQGGPSNAP
ncbi:MAG: ABC transporter permease subunit, partial [Pirellulaceae bacterium]